MKPPQGVEEAHDAKPDLYLITKSNISSERDSLRCGGTSRETTDDYWSDLAGRHSLDYEVLEESGSTARIAEAALANQRHLRQHAGGATTRRQVSTV